MEELASQLSDSAELSPSSEGNEVQKLLGSIADRAKDDKFLYTKFFAIGLFRLLELTGGVTLCLVRSSSMIAFAVSGMIQSTDHCFCSVMLAKCFCIATFQC